MRVRGALVAAAVAVGAFAFVPAHASTGVTVTPVVAVGAGLGFDACQAPATSTLRAWSASPYRTVNMYFSGTQRACPNQPDLSTDWVTTALSNGWSLLPTVVDLQPPCYGGTTKSKMSTDPVVAGQQGAQAATQADSDLRSLGLGGTVAYLDIENFDVPSGDTTCAPATLSFVHSWTTTLHTLGDDSGLYFNAHHGGPLFVNDYGNAGSPDDVWVADWNGQATPDDAVLGSDWTGHRIHQYHGGATETYGGVSIDVDGDAINGDIVSAQPGSVVTPTGPPYTYAVSGAPAPLNERTEPTSSSPSMGTLANGTAINIECQAGGESVIGDPVWDKLDNGYYVSDVYTTTTGGNGYSSLIARCPSTDTTVPTATMKPLAPGVAATAITVAWSASDPANSDGSPSGVYNATARVRWAAWKGGGFSSWHTVGTTTASRLRWNVTAGYTYCFQVRATDLSGNTSPWSGQSCTMRALDDRSMTLHTGWTRESDARFYNQTYTQATSTGRSLTRTQAVTDRLGIVATLCSRCGSLRVYISGHYVGTVNLYASATHFRHVSMLGAFASRTGTVTLTTTSRKLVQVDGIVISRA
jgi:hypothetical protein